MYVSRKRWGARPPEPGPGFLIPSSVKGIALHWPGTKTRYSGIAEVSRALRAWQKYHMDDKGWSDIAYQQAIDQNGNFYRLRGLSRQSAANGDETVNQQYGALLLVVGIGEIPSNSLIRATRNRIAEFQDRYPNGTEIVGHKDIRNDPTDCPGDKITALIKHGRFTPKRKR